MQKIYLRVQHAIRTGPYTLPEILQLDFTADDLFWVIGQSEDWLPPQEIPSLQDYFTTDSAGTPLVKEEYLQAIRENRFVPLPVSTPPVMEPPPVLAPQAQGTVSAQEPSAAEQRFTASLAAATERLKAAASSLPEPGKVASRFKQGATNLFKPTKAEEGEEEADSLFSNKKAVLGVLGIVLVFFFGNLIFNSDKSPKKKLSYTAAPLPVAEETVGFSSVEEAARASGSGLAASMDADLSEPEPEAFVAPAGPRTEVDAYIDSLRLVSSDREPGLTHADYAYAKPSARFQRLMNNRKSYKAKYTGGPVVPLPAKGSTAAINQQVSLNSRYIREGGQQNLKGMEVSVKNNSSRLLKSVQVEVRYYKQDRQFLEKETMRFSNIYPHQSLTLSIPAHSKAASAQLLLGSVVPAKN